MESVLNVASYIANKYFSEYGQQIDEMKLHKLMYFVQRESYIQTGHPLFDATFYGWKYGPILKEIRSAYRNGEFPPYSSDDLQIESIQIIDRVFCDYAGKNSWSLSRLTHGELSWKNSRIGIQDDLSSDNPMKNEDIMIDAQRIKDRRKMLQELGL